MSTQVVDREVGRIAYRVDEAPAALGISEWCVRKHIRDRNPRRSRRGGRQLIPVAAIGDFLATNEAR